MQNKREVMIVSKITNWPQTDDKDQTKHFNFVNSFFWVGQGSGLDRTSFSPLRRYDPEIELGPNLGAESFKFLSHRMPDRAGFINVN